MQNKNCQLRKEFKEHIVDAEKKELMKDTKGWCIHWLQGNPLCFLQIYLLNLPHFSLKVLVGEFFFALSWNLPLKYNAPSFNYYNYTEEQI